jgi:hypothetical protein
VPSASTAGKVQEEPRHEGVDVTRVEVEKARNSGPIVVAVSKQGQAIMFEITGTSDQLFLLDLYMDYMSSAEHISDFTADHENKFPSLQDCSNPIYLKMHEGD